MQDFISVSNNDILLLSLDSPLFSKGAIHFGLGAESIAGHLLGAVGVVPTHIDLQLDHEAALRRASIFIRERLPRIIGISTKIGSLDDLHTVLQVISEARIAAHRYDPVIVLGGVYATFAAHDLFDIALGILGESAQERIFIVLRQGEYPLAKLIQQGFRDVPSIPNIVYYDQQTRSVVETLRAKTPLPFSGVALPTAQTVSEVLKRNGMIWAEFSRGCQSFCTFCSIKELRGSRDLEERPAELVVENLARLADLGVRSVAFSDDDFPVGSENAQRFAQDMIAGGLNKRLSFSISTRSTNIIRPGDDEAERVRKLECFRHLVQAGLKDVFIGLESFSTPQLKRYGILPAGLSTKGEKKQADANAQVVDLLENYGVTLVAGFIPIDPMMTDIEELACNLTMLKESQMYKHVTNPLHVLRVQVGTAYEKLAMRAGLISDDRRVDLVFYDSAYANEVIDIIAQVCGNWNARKGSTDYALKTLRFASFSDNQRFAEAQQTIEQIRLIDLDFGLGLCAVARKVPVCVEHAGEQNERVSIEPGSCDCFLKSLASVLVEFEEKRRDLLASILEHASTVGHRELCDAVQADIDKLDDFLERVTDDYHMVTSEKAFLSKRSLRTVEAIIA
jgi:radical SAM superfamily enzyme YgiQ (UPF0313 family)